MIIGWLIFWIQDWIYVHIKKGVILKADEDVPDPSDDPNIIQEWFRSMPMMEGFFLGSHAGRSHGEILDQMYDLQSKVVHISPWEQFKCKYSGITISVCIMGILFMIGAVLAITNENSSTTPVWYIFGPIMAAGGDIFIGAAGFVWQRLNAFNMIYIPIHIIQYDRDDQPYGTFRIVGNVPRLAYLNEEEPFFYGPEGGGILTATRIRVKSRTYIEKGQAGNPSYTKLSGPEIYKLPARIEHSSKTEGENIESMFAGAKRAAENRPRSNVERNKWWRNKESAYIAVFVIAGIIGVLMIASDTTVQDAASGIGNTVSEQVGKTTATPEPEIPGLE